MKESLSIVVENGIGERIGYYWPSCLRDGGKFRGAIDVVLYDDQGIGKSIGCVFTRDDEPEKCTVNEALDVVQGHLDGGVAHGFSLRGMYCKRLRHDYPALPDRGDWLIYRAEHPEYRDNPT